MRASCKIETRRRKILSKNDVAFLKEAAWLVPNTVGGVSVRQTQDMQINGQNHSKSKRNREESIHSFPKTFAKHGKVQALASGLFA